MASVTVDSAAAANTVDGGPLRLDSIPIVDLRLLSQSELYSLSLCSSSSDASRGDDVVTPIIDRSVFNESAGSRKQTYSRFRLAPSSSSSATLHRRTPHLRSTATTFGSLNDKSDPENVENAQIINLLKQIFVADMKTEDLVPVKIEYSNSIPVQQLSSPPLLSPPNVGIIGQKRKRGRPRRDEALGIEIEKELVTGVGFIDVDVGVSDADGFSSLNTIFVHDNGEEKDKEVLNRDGVAVDLVALSAVEHPYSEEIRCRTEGLQTEEEFLEFLTGLNGQWGSRRKKKRIVDASDFASLLPVGWKLSLAIKKKNGHVWLYCRRYISPSGLHFVSCKGVSSYLLALHGVQDINLPGSAHYNDMVIDADKFTSAPIANLASEEVGKGENIVSHASSPAMGLTTGDHERQVIANAGNLSNDKMGDILHCSKSNVNFSEKDESLQHQSSLPRRNRHKNGTRITDGVIINDGKYECQFCHKTFSERHRYNGHVGTHVRYQAKTAGESSESVIPNSLNEVPTQDISIEGSLKSDDAVEKCNSNSIKDNELNICSPSHDNNEHVGDLKGADGNMRGMDKATDTVPETIPCSLAVNESVYDDARLNDSRAEMIEHLPLVTIDGGNENSASTKKLEQIMASESLLDSNNQVEECVVNNSEHIDQPRNEHKLDCEKFAVDGSIFDSFENQGDLENNLAFHVKEKSDSVSLSCIKTGTTDISILQITDDEKACVEDDDPCLIQKDKVEEALSVGDYEDESCKADIGGVNSLDNMQLETALIFPSWDEQENASQKDMSKSQLVDGNESVYRYESNDDGVCRKKTEMSEFDAFQNFGNGESIDPFSSGINSNSIRGAEQGNKIGVCSPFTSASDKQLFTDDNMIRMFNDSLEENRQESSGGMLLGQSGVQKVSNKIENTGKHGLSLSFSNLQPDMCTDLNSVEQERYQANGFNIDSFVHKTYQDPTHLSIVNSNIPDVKQDRLFGIEFPTSSFNNRADIGSSFNMAQPGRENLGTAGQNFMVGLGNSLQSDECVGADGSWRSGHGNVFENFFDANSGPQIPSSSCFRTFGLTSDKGQGGSFAVNQNYGVQRDMFRQPGRIQPVEYSFMGEQSSNSLPGESKILSYNTNMEQGLDPSFWLGKDALTPNVSHPSQVTSVCVWCRNVFFQDSVQAGIHTGAIGTMCPSCSSRMPGQFNVL